jgi:hypothetical protein
MKDWTGNNKAVYTCLGASNHALEDRQVVDYYATDPKAAELLLQVEPYLNNIWECACGEGHLGKVFSNYNKLALTSDLINRGYGNTFVDFLKTDREYWYGDIVTNPPYKYAKEFVEKAIELVQEGRKVCMFLKLTFLEGKARKELFKKYPPKTIYVCSGRIPCAKNGDFDKYPSSAIAYAWYVWEKGYKGETVVKWIN